MIFDFKRTGKLLIWVCIFILPVINYMYGTTDPFLFRNIAHAQILYNESFISINSPELYDGTVYNAPAGELNIIIISKIIGIPPKSLHFIPILAIPFIFSLYIFIKKIVSTKSSILIALSILIVTYSMSRGSTNIFIVFPHVFAYILFPISIALLNDILIDKNNKKIILLLIILIGIHFYYYSIEVWMLSVLLAISLILFIRKIESHGIYNLTLISFIMTIGYNRMIYGSYLPTMRLKFENMEMSTSTFFQKYFQQYSIYNYKVPIEYTIINILFLIFVSMPIFIYFIKIVREFRKKYIKIEPNWFYIQISLILVVFIDFIIYFSEGVITLRGALFIFPIVSISFVWKYVNRKIIRNIWIISILLLSILAVVMSYNYGIVNKSLSRYSEFEPGCNWIIDNGVMKYKWEGLNLLSDQPTIEKCFLESAVYNKDFKRAYIDGDSYKKIIENNNSKFNRIVDYVILNMEFNRMDTIAWRQYESFIKYSDNISSNINFNKIYSDNVIWIIKPSDRIII